MCHYRFPILTLALRVHYNLVRLGKENQRSIHQFHFNHSCSQLIDFGLRKLIRSTTLIVGGGIVGSAIAYFLSTLPDFDGEIFVVERDFSYEDCSTTRSVGSIRQQFSTKENIQISQFGFEFLENIDHYLHWDDQEPDIGLVHSSYLILASQVGLEALRFSHELQLSLGADVYLLDAAALRKKYPWLNTEGLAAAGRGLSKEGWFDPYSLLVALKRTAITLGVTYFQDEAVAIHCSKNRVMSVELRELGMTICDHFVNAAGPFAGKLASLAGIHLPVTPKRRNVFVFESPAKIDSMPLVVDPSGFYVRPEGNYFITGYSPGPDEHDPDDESLEVDHELFEDKIWPNLANRIPQFERLRVRSAWAGHYDYNSFDQNGIVGSHPEIENYYFANGFSGHGLQQAPAVGLAIAELIAYGEYEVLNLENLGYERILENRKFREKVII